MRNRNFCGRAVDTAVRQLGRLDVLVNDAAFQIHAARPEDLTEEHFELTLRADLYRYLYPGPGCS